MSQKGLAALPIIVIAAAVLIIAGVFFLGKDVDKSSPTPTSSSDLQTPTPNTPQPKASNPAQSISKPLASGASKSTCNDKKEICFNVENPTVNIQEGYLEDANHWISRDLMLTGQGAGGYTVTISGFPKEISARVPEQNFSNGGSQSIYLRAQKDVTKKTSYSGTISVFSFLTKNTTTTNLTINFNNWDTNAIHADPAQISVDCKVIDDQYDKSKRTQDCGKYDDHFVKFYYLKNDKTIEMRLKKAQDSDAKSINLDTELYHAKTLYKGQDVYSLTYYVNGFGNDVSGEQNATYTGWIQFIDQASQKEIINIPYTIRVHAYGS